MTKKHILRPLAGTAAAALLGFSLAACSGVYTGGDDVITDYEEGVDKIRMSTTSISITSVDYTAGYEGKTDVTFYTSNGGSLTVKNGGGKAITMTVGGKTRTTTYNAPTSDSNANVYDLLYDNNFTTDEFGIDDISEVKADNYSVGDVNTDTNANLVPDQNTITYGEDDKK